MGVVKDDLSGVPVERQQRYQLRASQNGLCILCKQHAVEGTKFCAHHLVWKRRYQRNYRRTHRRVAPNATPAELESLPAKGSVTPDDVQDRRVAGAPRRDGQTTTTNTNL